MKNSITKQVYDHLGYLGYTVEDISEKENPESVDFILARSERKSNLIVRVSKDNTIFISARYTISTSNKIVTEKFLNKLNTLNHRAIHTKIYYRENSAKGIELAIETFLINYDKSTLTMVVDILESDVVDFLKELEEYYSSPSTKPLGQTIVDELMHPANEEERVSGRIGF